MNEKIIKRIKEPLYQIEIAMQIDGYEGLEWATKEMLQLLNEAERDDIQSKSKKKLM